MGLSPGQDNPRVCPAAGRRGGAVADLCPDSFGFRTLASGVTVVRGAALDRRAHDNVLENLHPVLAVPASRDIISWDES